MTIKRLLSTLLLLFSLCSPLLAGSDNKATPSDPSKGILFIGNSYTYVHDLPGMVEKLLKAGKKPMPIDSFTRGATALSAFYSAPELKGSRDKLESGDFSWVVLQDQSQTPAMRPQETLRYVKLWTELAAKYDTKPVLFLTWAHAVPGKDKKPTLILDMQDRTSYTYCQAAMENKILVAPVGEAWRAWYAKYPQIPLHCPDMSHSNELGTYMAACIFYNVLTGESPVGLPALARIQPKIARQIQKIAASTVSKFTPKSCMAAIDATRAARPTEAEARALLVKGITVKAAIAKLGKPSYINRQKDIVVYQFQLQNDGECCLYCKDGKPYRASLRTGEFGNMDIIDLE